MSYADRLSGMENEWGTAQAPAGGMPGEPLPGGDHTVTVSKSEIIETKKGELMWLLVYTDEHDREVEKWHNLERKESVPYIKGDALAFSYTGTFGGLIDWAPTIQGSMCRIRVKWKSGTAGDGFPTVYLNEVVELAKAEPKTEPRRSQDGPDDDLPF